MKGDENTPHHRDNSAPDWGKTGSRGWSEGRVNESFDSGVPALRASILFVVCNHALTRVAIPCRRFAPLFFAHPVEAQGTPMKTKPASKRRQCVGPAVRPGFK